ncbi:MAG: glycine zipper domain-containing protein [Mariprofundus sp.]|nr:glycine zipper domain-containing protein [Mariprofundus sp.]
MKKMLLGLIFLTFTTASAYAGPQERGVLTGAAVGATAGAIIGSRSNETVEGAAIGAMFGAIAGAILSDARDEPVSYRQTYYPEPAYKVRQAYEEHREHEMLERYHRRHVRMNRNGYGYNHSGVYRHYRKHGYGYYNRSYINGRYSGHAAHEAREAHERREYLENHGRHQYGNQRRNYAWAD